MAETAPMTGTPAAAAAATATAAAARSGAAPRRRVSAWPGFNARGALSVVALLAAWALLTSTGVVSAQRLPSPGAVLDALGRLVGGGVAGSNLWQHAAASVGRWFTGFAIAVLLALPLGIAFAVAPRVRWALYPLFEVLRYIPPFAWIPIAIIWFGPGLGSQALVVAIAAFAPIVLNTWKGLAAIDPILHRAGRMLGASEATMLRRVAVPTAMPAILTGLRIALGNGWMALMGAELIAGQTGLGFLVVTGQRNGDLGLIVTAMALIGVLGAACDVLVRRLALGLTSWRKGQEANG